MLIKVTQTDIDNGIKGSCVFCPIAQALRKQDKMAISISVGSCFIEYFKLGECNNSLRMPEIACNFIRAFDKGLPVEPFEFEAECIE